MALSNIEKHYNKHPEDLRLLRRHGIVEFETTMHHLHRFLQPDFQVLDIGAGTGRYTSALMAEGFQVKAVELVKRNIDVFLKREPTADVVKGDARDMPFLTTAMADVTLLLGPLYHLIGDEEKLKALNKSLPEALKKSILQEAIMGRLVPQDPTEEPASALLARIRKEKEQLVKDGKLKKKDLVTTPITDEEKPFDIPESWEWCRVGHIFQTYSGGTPDKGHPEYYSSKDIMWAKVADLGPLYLSETEDYISNIGLDNSSAKLYPENTVLVAMYCNDAIGKSTVTKSVMASNQAICGILPNKYILPEFLYYAIQHSRPALIEKSAGGAQKNINQKIVNDIIFPLPPLSEQHRIVKKIEELFDVLK